MVNDLSNEELRSNADELEQKSAFETPSQHNIKIEANALVKKARDAGIPSFISFYIPGQGYFYNGIWPEEIEEKKGRASVSDQDGRFLAFLQVCADYNIADEMPRVRK